MISITEAGAARPRAESEWNFKNVLLVLLTRHFHSLVQQVVIEDDHRAELRQCKDESSTDSSLKQLTR